ncbi:MAG TPA: SpoIIE family protein phosphatase [Spirochaetota bacterium]|nr:SpoIIE family protein phosphatase [Spirochaetota bacterium]
MKILRNIALIVIIATAAPVSAEVVDGHVFLNDRTEVSHLAGMWLFKTGDSPEYARPEHDDSQWDKIRVPGGWHIHGYKYDGTAWYRMRFTLGPRHTGEDLKIMTPYIDHAVEIYLNGSLIGGRGEISESGMLIRSNSRNNVYTLPKHLVRYDRPNVLAFRIAGAGGIGGFAFPEFYIGAVNLIDDLFYRYLIRTSFLFGIFIFVGFYYILLYLWRKKETHYLSFGILSILTGLQQITLKTVGFWIIDDNWINLYINTFVQAVYPVCLMDFFHRFYNDSIRWVKAAGIAMSALFAVLLTVIFAGIWYDSGVWFPWYGLYWKYIVPVILINILLFIFYCLYLAIKNFRNHGFENKILLTSIVLYIVFLVAGMLSYLSIIDLEINTEMGFVTIIISMAFAMAYKFSYVHKETDRLNVELEEKNQTLTRIDKIKDDFLANTSHELRTPLNGIIGIAESLIDGVSGTLPDATLHNLSLIVSSGKRLSSLINDILDYSKLKNNEVMLKLRPVDIHQVAEIVISLLRTMVMGKDIALKNEIPKTIPLVYADENRVQQILYNLIGNAIKFTDHGSIRINARTEMNAARTEMIEISIADTGIGIPREKFSEIFKSFEQLEESLAREHGGTGLGLSISKQLIELQGGTIQVDSTVGEGSVFTFTLPAARGHVLTDTLNAVSIPVSEGNKKKPDLAAPLQIRVPQIIPENGSTPENSANSDTFTILAVDDEPINLQVLENLLTGRKYRFYKAVNGHEALEFFSSHQETDLILLDVMMPRMSGYEVCKALRKQKKIYELPILMLTAKNQIHDIVTGFKSGANDYLQKPFDRSELLARIDTLLTMKSAVSTQQKYISLQRELEIARELQISTLPESIPGIQGLDINISYFPMKSVSGDFYDFHYIDDSTLGILISDASGHGIPAAIIAGMMKIAFYIQKNLGTPPADMLPAINSIFGGNFKNQLMSAGYLVIDMKAHTLNYVSAGHPPVFLFRKKTGSIVELNPRGKIMGWMEDIGTEVMTETIEPGDRIIAYTDGIIELMNRDGELFGEKRFLDHITATAHHTGKDFLKSIFQYMAEWSGSDEGSDDMTLIVADVLK